MDSAYAKLGRAQEHLRDLHDQVEGYRARFPIEFQRKQVPHMLRAEQTVIKIYAEVKEPAPALAWSLTVGDILTNLRAALDHAVCNHARTRNVLSEDEERKISFPILTKPQDWFGVPTTSPNKVAGARVKLAAYCAPGVLHAIEQNQPFKVTDQRWHGIHVLNSLVNLDKHRSIRVVSYSTKEIDITKTTAKVVKKEPYPDTPMEDGALVGAVTIEFQPPAIPGPIRRGRFESVPLNAVVGYVESIDALGISQPLLDSMDALATDVETVLNELRAAGC